MTSSEVNHILCLLIPLAGRNIHIQEKKQKYYSLKETLLYFMGFANSSSDLHNLDVLVSGPSRSLLALCVVNSDVDDKRPEEKLKGTFANATSKKWSAYVLGRLSRCGHDSLC